MDVNIQDDLNAINDQINKVVEEFNKVNAVKEQLAQQLQNLNGVAMYLRGKLPPEEQQNEVPEAVNEKAKEMVAEKNKKADIQRSAEYPPDK
jgi:hypothetical protein|tara:strand:- start:2686 stop:2961 length:276 start_codon:yes stop_codon:yes gene_type:complete